LNLNQSIGTVEDANSNTKSALRAQLKDVE
jgi:hypothetical protein